MADTSPSLALPYLAPAQAQKHVTHNEALQRLDILVQLRVQAFDAATPPAVPEEGAAYALGPAPKADWAGQAGQIAAFTDGAWLFIAPQEGWIATEAATGALRVYREEAWRALPLDNLEGVGINASADATNRLAVAADATLLSHAGAGHQLKINKAAATDTASLLFQSGWTGHAEMGLAGGTDFAVKVSADGTTFQEALRINATTGFVGIGTHPSRRLSIAGDVLAISTGSGAGLIANRSDGVVASLQAGLTTARFQFDDTGDFAISNNTRPNIATATAGAAGIDFIVAQSSTGNVLLVSEGVGKVGIGAGATAPKARLDVDGAIRPGNYTVATLPNAATVGAGAMVYVTNAAGGGVPAFSDGSVWRRCTDRSVVN